jgi:hypothetical protein
VLKEDSLRVLSQLPLRVLSLNSIVIDAGWLAALDAAGLIATHFPHLEVFRCPFQSMRYKDFYLFTKMPKLEYLGVHLDRQTFMLQDMGRLPRVPPPGKTTLQILECPPCGGVDRGCFTLATYVSNLTLLVPKCPYLLFFHSDTYRISGQMCILRPNGFVLRKKSYRGPTEIKQRSRMRISSY